MNEYMLRMETAANQRRNAMSIRTHAHVHMRKGVTNKEFYALTDYCRPRE